MLSHHGDKLSAEAVRLILARMGERKISQRRLAELSGISRQTINPVLLRKRAPDFATLGRMLEPLGLTPGDVLATTPASQAPPDRLRRPVNTPATNALVAVSRLPSQTLRIHFYDLLALAERPLSEDEEQQLAAELERVRAMFDPPED